MIITVDVGDIEISKSNKISILLDYHNQIYNPMILNKHHFLNINLMGAKFRPKTIYESNVRG